MARVIEGLQFVAVEPVLAIRRDLQRQTHGRDQDQQAQV